MRNWTIHPSCIFLCACNSHRDRTHISCTGRWNLYHWTTWEAWWTHVVLNFLLEIFRKVKKKKRKKLIPMPCCSQYYHFKCVQQKIINEVSKNNYLRFCVHSYRLKIYFILRVYSNLDAEFSTIKWKWIFLTLKLYLTEKYFILIHVFLFQFQLIKIKCS